MRRNLPLWFLGPFLIAAGIVSFLGARNEWGWFMNHPKARFFINLMGRHWARLFYMGLGVVLAAIGSVSVFLWLR